jgi:uncharacterized membrane protein
VVDSNLLHEDDAATEAWTATLPLPWIAGALLAVALGAFLLATPSGVLGKAEMVGYAVCHQIDSHTFTLGGHHLPLCARCTGTFIGALIGLIGQAVVLHRGRASAFPPSAILAVLLGGTALWAIDGFNSYLALIGLPHGYEPANQLRLITGTLNGLTMSALIYPVFNVSVWRSPADRPGIRGPRDLGVLFLMEVVFAGLLLWGKAFLLYPFALVSSAAVLTLLTSVNTVLAVIVLGRENSVTTWRQALLPLSVGLLLSLLQVGLIDLVRYAATGTLGGLPSLQ